MEALIIQTICTRNGSMPHDELMSEVRPFDDGADEIIDKSETCAVVWVNGVKRVLVQTKLRLCRSPNCTGCDNLHMCKWFLFGSCHFGTRRRPCRHSHDMLLGKNAAVLLSRGLSSLLVKELCVLLLQSDASLLPQVCYSYNNGVGEYGNCKDGENCRRLHICVKYLRGSCDCMRSHDFYEPHPLKTLQDRKIPMNLMGILKDIYSNIEALKSLSRKNPESRQGANPQKHWPKNAEKSQRESKSRAEKAEICLYYIKGFCKHGDNCSREHSFLPYKWEEFVEGEWIVVQENVSVERDYCSPEKTCSAGVCFDTMTRGLNQVRRLSTLSSVLQPSFILTTRWSWFWEDEFGNWISYGSADGTHQTSSLGNEELELKFQQDRGALVEFTAGSQTYQLSFSDMIQTNKRYTTKKLVRRRPVFVSAADVQTIKRTKKMPGGFKALPGHWDAALTPDTGYKQVALQSSSTEHARVKNLFSTTMMGFSIQSIQRIQNKALWEVFQWQKDYMKKKNGGGEVVEKQLFHGTDDKHLHTICTNNFDWRICGTHGTAFGKGSYFARDARYSHNYTGDSATRSMFVCRVLVGDYTKGEPNHLRPPSKDGGDVLFYDSCVNNISDPSIFVVFEKHQIYPEYLIEYSDSSSTVYSPSRVTTTTYSFNTQPTIPNISSSSSSSSFSSPPAPRVVYTTPSVASAPPAPRSTTNTLTSSPPVKSKSECRIA